MYRVILVVMIMLSSLVVKAEEASSQPAQNNAPVVVVIPEQAKYDHPDDFLYEEKVKDVLPVEEGQNEELPPQEEEHQADNTENEHPLYNDL